MSAKNPLGLLARLFRRSSTPNPVVTQLYTHALGQPLLVHPALGERLIAAYMSGAVEASEPLESGVSVDEPKAPESRVAILNISGGLVSRPIPGPCDDGPLSYAAVRDAFDRALEDDTVTAIVLRLDTPGGMASSLFDLTDHIFTSRQSSGGAKRIVAVVDDRAYSAGYAIAAACDEIWVSRTGGVGSVGVVSYHVDQSAYDANVGIKITAIYAGGHKIDFSSHFPLSDEAKQREQAEVNSLYGLFTASVARYRGMPVEQVVATDALTYTGQAAIDVGLATNLGTIRDALAAVAAGNAPVVAGSDGGDADVGATGTASASSAVAALSDVAAAVVVALDPAADRAAAAQQLVAAGLKQDITAALLEESAGITTANIGERMKHAQAVVDLCAAAGDRSLARDYIVKNTNIEIVRSQLLDMKAAGEPEIVTALPADAATKLTAAKRLDPNAIYEQRSK